MEWAVYKYELSNEEKSEELSWIEKRQYDLEKIIRNKYRAGILFLLAKNHVLTPSKIAFKLGAYPRAVMHHLDMLLQYKLVRVHALDDRSYRESFRLNERMPNWVERVIREMLIMHGANTLEKLTSMNKYLRRYLSRKRRSFTF